MKKLLLTIATVLTIMGSYASEAKMYNYEKMVNVENAIKFDSGLVKFNIPKISNESYIYNAFIKYEFDNCIKYETVLFDTNTSETIHMSILFYKDGKTLLILRNLLKNSRTIYKLNGELGERFIPALC